MSRRTQAERSDATKRALVEAALELLVERGWAGITSVAVCDRAGLTRGAFVYHFNGLPDLLAASLETHYSRLSEAVAAAPRPTTIAELVATNWAALTSANFKVMLEAWLAATNDAELRQSIGPVIERFAKLVQPAQRSDLLPDEPAQDFALLAHESMLGLSLGRATNGDSPLSHEQRVIDQLIRFAHDQDNRLDQRGTPR